VKSAYRKLGAKNGVAALSARGVERRHRRRVGVWRLALRSKAALSIWRRASRRDQRKTQHEAGWRCGKNGVNKRAKAKSEKKKSALMKRRRRSMRRRAVQLAAALKNACSAKARLGGLLRWHVRYRLVSENESGIEYSASSEMAASGRRRRQNGRRLDGETERRAACLSYGGIWAEQVKMKVTK
jgi:hypothetical protein